MTKPHTGKPPSIAGAKVAFVAACALSAFVSAQTQPASQVGAVPPGVVVRADGRLTINYRDASFDSVIDDFGRAAGLSVVKNVKVEGNVVSMASAPNGDSRDQAVELLNAAAVPLGYQLVLEGSVLKISRSAPVRLLGAERVVPRPSSGSTPEQATILTGIVQADGGFAAYLENALTAAILRVGVGDSVANGKIADIQIDRIAYFSDGKTTWVPVGENLAGNAVLQIRKEPRP